ncbi:MAG: hypothetical protein ACXAEF_06050 [Candidatus Thorarchaeota archaeon]|jgi:hypothetical protein
MKKNSNFGIVALTIALLLSMCLMPTEVAADPVWEDNFDDNNLDGWTVLNGTWIADNGYLEATGEQTPEINTIVHPCTQAFGIFDFDFYKTPSVAGWYYFIPCGKNLGAMALDLGLVTYDGIGVRIESDNVDVVRLLGNMPNQLGEYVHTSDFDGWYSVSLGIFSNYSVILWFEGELVVDTISLTSHGDIEYSYSMAPPGGAFDNIVVNPEPEETTPTETDDTDTTTSDTDTGGGDAAPIPMELLLAAIAIPVVLIVVVLILKKR